MSSWEERMSTNAKARQLAAETEEYLRRIETSQGKVWVAIDFDDHGDWVIWYPNREGSGTLYWANDDTTTVRLVFDSDDEVG